MKRYCQLFVTLMCAFACGPLLAQSVQLDK
jgi:hypothetical protein